MIIKIRYFDKERGIKIINETPCLPRHEAIAVFKELMRIIFKGRMAWEITHGK